MTSPMQQTASSGGSVVDPRYALYDEKKRKRMISNRESAQRSRMRKQQHVDDVLNQVNQLERENKTYLENINHATDKYLVLDSENNVLRAQVAELTDRLQSLNMLLEALSMNGVPLEMAEIPQVLLEPWQLPCPTQHIVASAGFIPSAAYYHGGFY